MRIPGQLARVAGGEDGSLVAVLCDEHAANAERGRRGLALGRLGEREAQVVQVLLGLRAR